MKKNLLLIILALFFTSNISAQIYVGKKDKNWRNLKELKSSDISKLKSNHTYFIYDDFFFSDRFTKDEYENVLKSVWTFTKFKVVTTEEYYKIAKPGMSVFVFNYSVCSETHIPDYICDPRIEFSIINDIKVKKKGVVIAYDLYSKLSILPFSDNDRFNLKMNHGGRIGIKMDLDVEMKFYKSLGVFSQEILFINNKLENGETYLPGIKDYIKSKEIKKLKKATLYITEEILSNTQSSYTPENYPKSLKKAISYKKFRSNLDKNIIEAKENYRFNLKFVTEKELSDKLLDKNSEHFYYIRRYNNYSDVRIVDNQTGEIVFRRYQQIVRRLNAKFFKKLSESIEIGKK